MLVRLVVARTRNRGAWWRHLEIRSPCGRKLLPIKRARIEIFEEVGIKVKNLEYFGSQPWPFPHSLMVGYLAEFESGDIVVDGKEIHEAYWCDVDDLPFVPPNLSIAGRLIEHTANMLKK